MCYNMVRSIKILRRLLYEYTRFRLFKRKDYPFMIDYLDWARENIFLTK